MPKLIYVAGPLFSEAERIFLEQMVDSIAKTSGLDPEADFFLPHRDGGELGKGPKRLSRSPIRISGTKYAKRRKRCSTRN